MKQTDYEIIIQCIQFGAPALAPQLVNSLNQTVEDSNRWLNEQKRIANEARQAEIKAAEDLKKTKDAKTKE